MSASQRVTDLQAEITRIKAKLSATSDRDIAEALQFKVSALNEQLDEAKKLVEEEQEKEAEELSKTVEEIPPAEIEREIRLARAHLAGDRKPAARDILAKLELAAPNNVDVLELKADMLIASKDFSNALPLLKKARKVDPKSVSIEKKLAEVAMRASTLGSIDDQLRSGLSDLPFIGSTDMKASATAATVCSIFLPGLGHLVTGMTTKGIVYMSIWICSGVPLAWLMRTELKRINGNMNNFSPSMLIIALGFIAAMSYFVALFECAALGKNKATNKRPTVERPKPPVDLPFE